MLKTKLFTSMDGIDGLGAIFMYQDFIKSNPRIKVVSVNISKNDFVLLTYIQ